jgi:hypothetical protein
LQLAHLPQELTKQPTPTRWPSLKFFTFFPTVTTRPMMADAAEIDGDLHVPVSGSAAFESEW